jgi:hypothetical protein
MKIFYILDEVGPPIRKHGYSLVLGRTELIGRKTYKSKNAARNAANRVITMIKKGRFV